MNKWMITGYIGHDLQLSKTGTGKSACKFSIAADDGKSDNPQETNWIDCIAWCKTAELINEYFKKGDKIELEGYGKKNTYQAKNGHLVSKINLIVEKFYFSQRNRNTNEQVQTQHTQPQQYIQTNQNTYYQNPYYANQPNPTVENVNNNSTINITDDDLPF